MKNNVDNKAIRKSVLPYLLIAVVMLGLFYILTIMNKDIKVLSYDEFIEKLNKNKIQEMEVITRGSGRVYEISGIYTNSNGEVKFETTLPLSEEIMKKIVEANDNGEFKMTAKADPDASSIWLLLVNVLPIVVFVIIIFWFFNKQMAGNKSSLDFGKSRARLNSDNNKVTFKDVAGLTEEKEEVKELIDFLKDPKKFQN